MFISKLARIIFAAALLVTLSPITQATADQCCETQCCQNIGSFKVYADFIYWKTVQDQMAYAAILPGGVQKIIQDITNASESESINLSENLKVTDPSFKYQPGFKLGFGYTTACSDWDFNLVWTELHQKNSSSVSDSTGGVFPLAFPASVIFGFISGEPSQFAFGSEAKSQWKFDFDTVDFEIGKNYSFCNCVAFRPFVGVKAAAIRQNQHTEYFGFSADGLPIIVQNKKKNNFHGVGPSLGFDASWEFYSGCNLTSGVCAALLCGKFDAKDSPFATQEPISIGISVSETKKCRVRPTVDMDIGLDWCTCVCDKYGVMIGVSYEAQYWWNQWQVPNSVVGSILNGGTSPQGDLMMQGLTLELALFF
jgi:hypothetical protein